MRTFPPVEVSEKIRQVEKLLLAPGHLPTHFLASVQGGVFETLLIAADYREDEGRTEDAVLLRSAYYRFAGESPIVDGNSGMRIHYNCAPNHTTDLFTMKAAIVNVGESITILNLIADAVTYTIGSEVFGFEWQGIVTEIKADEIRIRTIPPTIAVYAMADFVRLNWQKPDSGDYNYTDAASLLLARTLSLSHLNPPPVSTFPVPFRLLRFLRFLASTFSTLSKY